MAPLDGPGGVEVTSTTPVSVLFYNFGKNSDIVKYEHLNGLVRHIAPVLDQGGSVTLIGMASRTGPEGFNVRLSRARAASMLSALARIVGDRGKAAHAKLGISEGSANAARAGNAPGFENPRFRAVSITAALSSDPPDPQLPDGYSDVDTSDLPSVTVGDFMDRFGVAEGFVSTTVSIAELISEAGWVVIAAEWFPVIDGVFLVIGFIWTFKEADDLAHFNGWARGFMDAWQDMASTYSDRKLDPHHPENWPDIPKPSPHFQYNVPDSALTASDQEARRGMREGADAAYKAVQNLEQNPKDLKVPKTNEIIKGTGKVTLWWIYQARKGDVSGAVLEAINKKLHEKGKGDWPLH
jgi:hypothetical protein